jgi:chemotaxis-related protein WspB
MLVLTFHVGAHRAAIDIRRVEEVIPRVRLQPLPGGPYWVAGLFVHRGRAIPVLDLHRLLDQGECPHHLSSRIILVPVRTADRTLLVGWLAARVADIRELPADRLPDAGAAPAGGAGASNVDLGPVLVDERGILHVVDPDRLLPESSWGPLLALPVA